MRIHLFVWLLILSLCTGPVALAAETEGSAPEPARISDIRITVKEASPAEIPHLKKMARDLIYLEPGDRFSPEKLNRSLEALKLSKHFKTIHADSRDTEAGMMLIFSLSPFERIQAIHIDGNFPVFEQEILNVMTVYPGDVFLPGEMPKQENLITELLERQGFVDPTVTVTGKKDPEVGHYLLNVDIQKPDYEQVDRFVIKGNHSFSATRLKLRTKTWWDDMLPGSAGRLIREDVKADLKKIVTFYRKKRYPEVSAQYDLKTDPDSHEVTVVLTINEGPYYTVRFEGNDYFWDRSLKKELVIYTEGNKNDFGLKKSIRNMEKKYRDSGFLSAEIKMESETVDQGKRRDIGFIITQGPQSLVQSVEIQGNQAFDADTIKGQMLTSPPGFMHEGAFSPQVLKEDIQAIRSLYYKQGYLEPEITKSVTFHSDKTEVRVRLEIEEGPQTRISGIGFSGLSAVSEEKAREVLRMTPGQPIQEFLLGAEENKLAALISEQGYPHVNVTGKLDFSTDRREVKIHYQIEEGPYVETADVYLVGNFRTQRHIILNEMAIQPGKPFSPQELLESQRRMRDMDIFSSVRFKAIGLKEKADQVNLIVEIEEEKPYYIGLAGGYDTERGTFVQAEAGDRNLWGTNKEIRIQGELSQIGYNVETRLQEPRLFGTRFSANVGAFAEERDEFNQDFRTRTFGASLGFGRKWGDHLRTDLNFRYENREETPHDDVDPSQYAPNEFDPRSIFVTSPSVSYDSRDSFIRPSQGVYAAATVDISNGLENSLDNFVKYQVDLRYYYSPGEKLTLAWHGWYGYIDPFGNSQKVPDDQLFFLGGITDVRGFAENMLQIGSDGDPLGGMEAVLGSMEARIDIGYNFELTAFYDLGRLTENYNGHDTDEFRSAAGLGLRYLTPIGPIGFLYGFKLDPREQESSGKLHFSLGYTF